MIVLYPCHVNTPFITCNKKPQKDFFKTLSLGFFFLLGPVYTELSVK